MIDISIIKEEDNNDIIEILAINFGFIDSKEEILRKIKPRLNNGISIKASIDNKIVGCYLLAEKSLNLFFEQIKNNTLADFPKNETKIYSKEKISDNGLQGISLAVLPEYKNIGIGSALKNYTYGLGYAYIWGVQHKKLNNIDFWKNTREVIAESNTHYATLKRNSSLKYLKEYKLFY
jgi:GNAT superfamily N-acetyltransferase